MGGTMLLGAQRVGHVEKARHVEVCEDVVYVPEFLPARQASSLFAILDSAIDWQQESIGMFGRRVPVPRLVAWAGDAGVRYRYSGVDHVATGWPEPLKALRVRLTQALHRSFNFVLLNRYRTGSDHMGWHADDEPALGQRPMIASLSLGATRLFRLRRNEDRFTVDVALEHGSLLIMAGASQHRWRHALVATRRPVGERINLTFRQISDDAL